MKAFVKLMILMLGYSAGYAQGTSIDSLSRELSMAKHDTTKVMIMSEITYLYRLSNPDSGMVLGWQALKLAKKNRYLRGQSSVLSSIGAIYRIQGDLQNAISFEFDALKIAEENGFLHESAKAYFGIGNTYTYLKDYRLGINYLRKAIVLYQSLKNTHQYSIVYANIGDAYRQNNQLDSAHHYLTNAYRLMKKVNYVTGISFCLTRLARINLMQQNYQAARELALEAEKLGSQQKNIRTQSMSAQLLSDYYHAQNNTDSAIYFAQKAFDVAKAYNYKWDMLDNSSNLAHLYKTKDLAKAYYYSQLAKVLNDSIYGPNRVIGLQKRIIKEEELKKENEAKALAYQNQMKQNVLIGSVMVLILIGFLLYRNNRQKQRANLLLNEQKEKVEQTLKTLQATQAQLIQKEKLASLGELTAGIAHEIQNPLNFVNNFSELSVELLQELSDEIKAPIGGLGAELLADISQNLAKINLHGKRASSIVKGMLEHSRSSTGIKELTDINKLADEYLRLSYYGLRAKDSSFNCDYELITNNNLPKIEVVPQEIGRVLLNLLNNAFYAVNERTKQGEANYQPKVTVTTKVADNQLQIRVADNGLGIPDAIKDKIFQPFFTTKPTGEGTGLGLSLAYDIVTKGHSGAMEVESVVREGTTFIVKLPHT
jgi:two-component system, NtrC family, sensor kinase